MPEDCLNVAECVHCVHPVAGDWGGKGGRKDKGSIKALSFRGSILLERLVQRCAVIVTVPYCYRFCNIQLAMGTIIDERLTVRMTLLPVPKGVIVTAAACTCYS